jgi:hypothetical protein
VSAQCATTQRCRRRLVGPLRGLRGGPPRPAGGFISDAAERDAPDRDATSTEGRHTYMEVRSMVGQYVGAAGSRLAAAEAPRAGLVPRPRPRRPSATRAARCSAWCLTPLLRPSPGGCLPRTAQAACSAAQLPPPRPPTPLPRPLLLSTPPPHPAQVIDEDARIYVWRK